VPGQGKSLLTKQLAIGAGIGFAAALFGAVGTLALGLAGGLVTSLGACLAVGLALAKFGGKLFGSPPEAPAVSAPKLVAAKAVEPETPLAVIPPDRIDELTGLANANGLAAWFREKATRMTEDGLGIVVLVADLDRHADLERGRGKKISDSVLIEIAKRVTSLAGENGIAARTGGDEFAAIASVVPERTAEVAEEKAGNLAEIINRPVDLPTGAIWIAGSVGGAIGLPLEGEAVMARARAAHAKARRLGIGRYWVDTGKK